MKFIPFFTKYIVYAMICLALAAASVRCGDSDSESAGGSSDDSYAIAPVEKRSDMRIFVHYMPWFETKAYSGAWGMHWTMATCNPEITDADGRRQIASHFYPLIGPYDSNDPTVLDYHLLLMKYAGIEGVLVDWYGSRTAAASLEALQKAVERAGLEIAIVYEDRNNIDGAGDLGQMIQWGAADMSYLESKFFNRSSYTKVDDRPLLLCFGPIALNKQDYPNSPTNWTEIFAGLKTKPCFMPLYGHAGNASDERNKNVAGEFTWIDANNRNFYAGLRQNYGSCFIASAYPGFYDYYAEGGWGTSITKVDYRDGAEFREQLEVADTEKVPMIQLATWNDFGEGTQIEPTVEDGYKYLEIVQEFARVKYDRSVLESIHRLYTLRVENAGNSTATAKLNEAYRAFAAARPEKAAELMEQL